MIGRVAADDGGAYSSFLATAPAVMCRAGEVSSSDPPLTDAVSPLIATPAPAPAAAPARQRAPPGVCRDGGRRGRPAGRPPVSGHGLSERRVTGEGRRTQYAGHRLKAESGTAPRFSGTSCAAHGSLSRR